MRKFLFQFCVTFDSWQNKVDQYKTRHQIFEKVCLKIQIEKKRNTISFDQNSEVSEKGLLMNCKRFFKKAIDVSSSEAKKEKKKPFTYN